MNWTPGTAESTDNTSKTQNDLYKFHITAESNVQFNFLVVNQQTFRQVQLVDLVEDGMISLFQCVVIFFPTTYSKNFGFLSKLEFSN